MSYYTDLILSVDREDSVCLDGINTWLTYRNHSSLTSFGDVRHVYGGSFNHLDLSEFLDLFTALPWRDRPAVQLFVRTEDRPAFTLYAFQEPDRVKIEWTPHIAVVEKDQKRPVFDWYDLTPD